MGREHFLGDILIHTTPAHVFLRNVGLKTKNLLLEVLRSGSGVSIMASLGDLSQGEPSKHQCPYTTDTPR